MKKQDCLMLCARISTVTMGTIAKESLKIIVQNKLPDFLEIIENPLSYRHVAGLEKSNNIPIKQSYHNKINRVAILVTYRGNTSLATQTWPQPNIQLFYETISVWNVAYVFSGWLPTASDLGDSSIMLLLRVWISI